MSTYVKRRLGNNRGRDADPSGVADIRNVVAGNPRPDRRDRLTIARGIEVGQNFQLGRNDSESMDASVLDENGNHLGVTIGCYSIGVSWAVGASSEQRNDEQGVVWPIAIAPFMLALVAL